MAKQKKIVKFLKYTKDVTEEQLKEFFGEVTFFVNTDKEGKAFSMAFHTSKAKRRHVIIGIGDGIVGSRNSGRILVAYPRGQYASLSPTEFEELNSNK